jgi:sugar phosphate isomerase/epimerase
MQATSSLTRRSFLSAAAMMPLAASLMARLKNVPIGLELYSVRNELMADLNATVTSVAKLGYQVVEFYSPYLRWTTDQAKEVRKLLNDLGITCRSTHNDAASVTGDGLQKAIELNQIIGSTNIIMASAPRITGIDGWKSLGDQLTATAEKLKPLKMRTGYHNHQAEWRPVDGKRPMDVLAANTPADVTLQFDVGTCMEVGADPIAWINANPGRIRSMHLKDWSHEEGKGFRVLFGEGDAQWLKILAAAEGVGGVEYYLIEQEGSRFGSIETAERCLEAWKKMRA